MGGSYIVFVVVSYRIVSYCTIWHTKKNHYTMNFFKFYPRYMLGVG